MIHDQEQGHSAFSSSFTARHADPALTMRGTRGRT